MSVAEPPTVPAVRTTDATPLAFVVAVAAETVSVAWLVANVTTALATGAPALSTNVAVTVAFAPTASVAEDIVMVRADIPTE